MGSLEESMNAAATMNWMSKMMAGGFVAVIPLALSLALLANSVTKNKVSINELAHRTAERMIINGDTWKDVYTLTGRA